MRPLILGLMLGVMTVGCNSRGNPGSRQQSTGTGGEAQPWIQVNAEDLPLLRFTPHDGENALLAYKLTATEQMLFKKMDAATAELAKDSSLSAYHDAVAQVGAIHGLTRSQSVAFWTRATFSMFEQ